MIFFFFFFDRFGFRYMLVLGVGFSRSLSWSRRNACDELSVTSEKIKVIKDKTLRRYCSSSMSVSTVVSFKGKLRGNKTNG